MKPLVPSERKSLKIASSAVIFVTLLLIFAAVPIYAMKVAHKVDYTDFDVYYRAGLRTHTEMWSSIYSMADGASPFRYSPLTLPLFKPLALMSLNTAKLLWYFLQITFFALGFYFLYRAYIKSTERPFLILSLSILAVFRLCLDTFTIGQVSSLMFFGYCIALFGVLNKKSTLASGGLFIPTLFKIAPGFGYFYLIFARPSRIKQTLLAPFVLVLILTALLLSILPEPRLDLFSRLWHSWTSIVANDSVYYDASHYGSQSLKSVLLRAANAGVLTSKFAESLHAAFSIIVCAMIFVFWLLRTAMNSYGAGLSFSLALFANIWFMPETFKYSLTPLAIPIAFLLSAPKKRLPHYLVLAFTFFVISIAGLDLVGSKLFFGIQRLSLPFLATLGLGIYAWHEARKHSTPSLFAKVFGLPRPSLGPWSESPALQGNTAASFLMPVFMNSTSSIHLPFIKSHIEAARDLLSKRFGLDYEILVIAYGDRAHPDDHAASELRHWLSRVPGTTLFYQEHSDGRGAAVRYGFLKSTGKLILLGQLEQPCHVSFYEEAMDLTLNEKYEFIRGNRRLPESRFQIPVRVLKLIYRRHRLGLRFNKLVRFILPVRTTDTHSGHLVMTRTAALAAFSVQSSSDFLCDLEWSLAANAHDFHRCDLPVTVYMGREKSFLQMIAETAAILRGLPVLALRFKQGCYGPIQKPDALTADDWGLSKGVNAGILALARKGVIKRVSLMSTCAYLDDGLAELKAIPGISLGLHFNLTYGKRLSGSPIPDHCGFKSLFLSWILSPSKRKQFKDAALKECETQIAALERRGITPRYLDGHHHIHLLPGLLKILAPLLKSRNINQVRILSDPELIFGNKFPLYFLSLLVRKTLHKNQIQSLRCIYPHSREYFDPGKLRGRLSRRLDHEIITHPAINDDVKLLEYPDSYGFGRIVEFRALEMLSSSWQETSR